MGRLVFDQTPRVAEWVAKRTGQETTWGACQAFGVERGNELTAGVVLNNFNAASATAHIAVDKPGKDMLAMFSLVCDYAFRHAKLRRLTGMVPASDPKVLEFDLRIGFEIECTMKEAAYDGGDLHVLVMWARKCPWLHKE
jgi:RimJ/RimL family protein N-acetyltransferase